MDNITLVKCQMSTIESKIDVSSKLMELYRKNESWAGQKKFEFHYGQYMAFKEIHTLLSNMLEHEAKN